MIGWANDHTEWILLALLELTAIDLSTGIGA
jgi:hypothetical protein